MATHGCGVQRTEITMDTNTLSLDTCLIDVDVMGLGTGHVNPVLEQTASRADSS